MTNYVVLVSSISLCLAFCLPVSTGEITTGDIYTIDSLASDSENYSLVVADDKSTTVEPFSVSQPRQRFIARIVTGTTFNLFLEEQPWNWVNYIVESSKTVNIKDKTPQVLDSVLNNVVQNDYNGQNSQKWYVVPTGSASDVGRLVNLLTKFCLTNNGPSSPATAGICDANNSNQLWRISSRSQGRCY